MFSVEFTHARGRLFHGEGADLSVCYLQLCAFLKYMYTVRLFLGFVWLIKYANTEILIFCREKLDHRVKRKLRMYVFVYVRGANYIL